MLTFLICRDVQVRSVFLIPVPSCPDVTTSLVTTENVMTSQDPTTNLVTTVTTGELTSNVMTTGVNAVTTNAVTSGLVTTNDATSQSVTSGVVTTSVQSILTSETMTTDSLTTYVMTPVTTNIETPITTLHDTTTGDSLIQSPSADTSTRTAVIAGSAIGSVSLVALGALILFLFFRKKRKSEEIVLLEDVPAAESEASIKTDYKLPRPMSMRVNESEIDFNELQLGEVIGEGAFGAVYQGEWRHQKVAISKKQKFEIS